LGKSTWEAKRPALSLWFAGTPAVLGSIIFWLKIILHPFQIFINNHWYVWSQRGRAYLCNYFDSYGWRQIWSLVCWSLDNEDNSQFGSYIGISPYVSCKGYRRIKCLCPYWEPVSENFGLIHFDLKCLPCVSQILIFAKVVSLRRLGLDLGIWDSVRVINLDSKRLMQIAGFLYFCPLQNIDG